MANPSPTAPVQLIEINLIGDRMSHLFRRRALEQWCAVGSLVMLLVAVAMSVFILAHMTKALRTRAGNNRLRIELADQEKILNELDNMRSDASKSASTIVPLLPIARERIAWSPKMVAIAGALPPDTGLHSLRASYPGFFTALLDNDARQKATSVEKAPPSMEISILCIAKNDETDNQINPLIFPDRLSQSQDFMSHFTLVRLESTERTTWQGSSNRPAPVIVLRSHAEGEPVAAGEQKK